MTKSRPRISRRTAALITVAQQEKQRRAKLRFRENTDPDADYSFGKLVLPITETARP